jgi:hypothetical protein
LSLNTSRENPLPPLDSQTSNSDALWPVRSLRNSALEALFARSMPPPKETMNAAPDIASNRCAVSTLCIIVSLVIFTQFHRRIFRGFQVHNYRATGMTKRDRFL